MREKLNSVTGKDGVCISINMYILIHVPVYMYNHVYVHI